MSRLSLAVILFFTVGCNRGVPNDESKKEPEVLIQIIENSNDDQIISGVGSVRYRRETALSFTSSGRVARVTVSEGSRFERGRLLAALDTSTVDAQVAIAEANLERTRADFQRREALYSEGWATKRDLDASKSDLSSAQAVANSSSFQARSAKIFATGSGVVLRRLVEPYQFVAAGQPLLLIGEVDRGLVVSVPLPLRDIAQLRLGTPAEVTFPDVHNSRFTGRLIEIAEQSNALTGTFNCLFLLPNNAQFRVGQIGRVRLTIQNNEPVKIILPAAAVFDAQAGEGFVYLVDRGGRVRLQRIVIDAVIPRGISVREGVTVGDRVVVSGIGRLQDGARVKFQASAR